jgi:carboxypeptidase Q
MKVLRLFSCTVLFAAATAQLFARHDGKPDPYRKIVAEIESRNELMANLEYLSDMLGPRMTGSETLHRANEWTAQKFREYGAESVHQEPWILGRSWTRGRAEGKIVSPAEHRLTLASHGWTVGTNGVIRGPVVYIHASKPQDLESFKGKLHGAIVILYEPRDLEAPVNPVTVPYGDYGNSLLNMNTPEPPIDFGFFGKAYQFLTEQRTGAILMASDKKYGLLNTYTLGLFATPGANLSSPMGEQVRIARTPAAYVSWEDYNLIWRLLQRGSVTLELNIENSYSETPVEVYNTVAEFGGTERPDEVVILGAHLDSWDLGTGATDNGTGVAAVLEAARALLKSELKPKRTIRFVLFSGEEEGLLGSQAYVESHQRELPKISAMLVHDSGTGKVVSIDLEGDYAAREVMDGVVESMPDLGLVEPTLRSVYGSDDFTFYKAGVPGFLALQDPLDYAQTHHSQADTLDRLRKQDLQQGAKVLALWAYRVAQLPGMMPRQPQPEKKPGS